VSAAAGRELKVLVGPTASGKSAVAQYMAEHDGAAVLSADSMLIYRGMDIGTAKPDRQARRRVDYLGVDLADPCELFSVWAYREAVAAQLAELAPERDVVVAGGSGLYVKALTMGLAAAGAAPENRARWESLFADQGVEGLQQALQQRDAGALASLSDPRNPRRLIRALERQDAPGESGGIVPSWREAATGPVLAGLWMEPALLNKRIEKRVETMYAEGLLDEVAGLLADPRGLSPTARQAIGYAEAIAVLEGRSGCEEAMALTAARTRRLAKRQRTWFRHQARVEWVEVQPDDTVETISGRVREIWSNYGSARMAG
jgi:tRNA dimethylallyltransferase